ncbi:hypothetical protein Rleg9DRAFT_6529 [Rhizobium leguminosarum bv. trifolii WSM597]|uniref:Uncharacterized protein n=1 Tax=Rhizobium leguminosarum bv. trifolii WSM597 TaxID=754764 RepID=J0HAT8_RHILT|nr:hypothetical protein [Rhizobium leguminosarum]EJB07515.1 hypothetical protein Rleg9DRAFT_6529 [Rhizobium leguminosarum bv. trifolii WSM597]
MGQHQITVHKVSDQLLLNFFKEAAETVGSTTISINVVGNTQPVQMTWNAQAWSIHNEFSWLLKSDDYSIEFITTARPGIQVLGDRRSFPGGVLYDQLTITSDVNQTGGQPPLSGDRIKILNDLVSTYLMANLSAASLGFNSPQTVQSLLKSHQMMVTRLEGMVVDIGERATRARIELDEEFNARKSELELQFAERQTDAQRTIEEQKRILNEQEEELRTRANLLDDRNNTHARRALHEQLKTRLADRFKKLDLTPQTQSSRTPIHRAVVVTAIILAVLIASFTYEAITTLSSASSTWSERVLVIAKSATASLGFLGIISWYLRWLNRWFERLADAEFQLKQFELDINRAQWVVETAFEWKITQNAPIPDPLLENISRNLFSKSEKDENSDMHPADFLASAILGRASAVNLKIPGGGEISLDNRGIRKLQNERPGE